MVVGLLGVTGVSVVYPVMVVLSHINVLVPTPNQLMEVTLVLALSLKPNNATLDHAQVSHPHLRSFFRNQD